MLETRPVAEVDERLVAANTEFGFRLFAELLSKGPGSHLFISPSSIASALTMACNGAAGETREAMIKALQLEGIDWEDVAEANAGLRAALVSPDPRVQLSIANALWLREGGVFRQEFIDTSRDFYGAAPMTLDFAAPDAYLTINEWVREQTQGKIKAVVSRADLNTAVLLVVNALYFKGDWAEAFDPGRTEDGPFTLKGGARVAMPMMSRCGQYPYLEMDAFQAISLPYGEGKFSLHVFLPAPDSSLEEFCGTLSAETWNAWMSRFTEVGVAIKLPRFGLQYRTDLTDALKALGMGVAFEDGQPEFAGMVASATDAWISRVLYETVIQVNEEGTEAAAATSVVVPAPRPTPMVVDRPFFCAVRDNETGSILLMGVVYDPEAHYSRQRLWSEEG